MNEEANTVQVPARSRRRSLLMQMLGGEFLRKEYVLANLPFFIYLAVLGTLYIANSYFAVNRIREITRLENEIRDYQSRYITLKAALTEKCKSSHVAEILEGTGISESVEPPRLIEVKSPKPLHIY